MSKTLAVFSGNSSGQFGVWVTDGTVAGTSELSVGLYQGGSASTAFGSKVVFDGFTPRLPPLPPIGNLWVTDGTAAGTSELSVAGASSAGFGLDPIYFTVFGTRVLFEGQDSIGNSGLWTTDGTAAGTSEIKIVSNNAFGNSAIPYGFQVFGSEVLFDGVDSSGHANLWVTDGTAAGTSELSVAGAASSGLFSPVTQTNPQFTVLGSKVLFDGRDSSGNAGLWATDGTAAGTSELSVAGAASSGLSPFGFTVFGSKVLFDGVDSGGHANLWVTDGTSAGTSELSVAGAFSSGLFSQFDPQSFTVLGSKALFAGRDSGGKSNLWVTDGTGAGTSEIQAVSNTLGGLAPRDFKVLGSEALFSGYDSSGQFGLWVTDGTAAGTSELSVAGAFSSGLFPSDLTVFGNEMLFSGRDSSGLWGLWMTDGTAAGTSEVRAPGASFTVPGPSGLTVFQAPCYLTGTRIATPNGDVAVEQLRIGDDALLAAGGARPIVWIGQRRIDCTRHSRPELVWPVRIRAGAFAEDLPGRDLLLSPDHSVFVDGVLIPIKYLINDATIVQERIDTVHYFHIELDRHDVLLADGLPAESYLDTGNRAAFANGGAHMVLHPDFAPLSWDNACAPLCAEGSPIAAVRSRLRVRALELSGLHVEADGRVIRPAALKGSRLFQFLIPPAAREVRIVSRAGAEIGGILLDGKVVGLDSPVLADGGAVRLPLPDRLDRRGYTLLELAVHDIAPKLQSPGDPVEQVRAA